MELYWENQSIEGDKISGQSRRELRWLELVRGIDGRRYQKFEAKFDVSATIDEPINGAPILCPNAVVTVGAKVQCDKAVCESADRKPSTVVTKGSASHQTNAWRFGARTLVRIIAAHESLKNGAAKRLGVAQLGERQLK